MKLPNLSLNDLFRSPPLGPVLAGAHVGAGSHDAPRADDKPSDHLLFARGSDDDGFSEYDDDPPYEEPAQGTRRAPGAQRGSGGAGGSGGGGNGGRQRSVQFQPEERYWTEYLRIALPIVGLLLMIGLFWYWASQLTDDDNGGEPITTETPGVAELITPDSTPAPTQQVVVPPTSTAAEEPASTPEADAPADEETPVDEPVDEEPAAESGAFAVDDPALVNDDGVNLRSAATTAEDNVVATLDSGEALSILGGPTEAEEYVWWEVIVESTGDTGFIVEDFIDPAEAS